MIYLLFIISVMLPESKVNEARDVFFTEFSKEVNEKLLSICENANTPVLKGYEAVAIIRKAEYSVSPYSKYNYFKKGKNLLEQTIMENKDIPELNFLRLTVQLKSPSFLGYNDKIDTDLKIVKNALNSKSLFQGTNFYLDAVDFLLNEGQLTSQEAEIIKQKY